HEDADTPGKGDPDVGADRLLCEQVADRVDDVRHGLVRAFAERQPVTAIVNTIRDLFTQQPVGTDIWIALAWCVGILMVAYIFAMVTYRRRISS
ncbi:MAG TPA: ABC transporter permease, partial [Dehalococcoidia bacterium]|nr:ABC transporter permease [Dehalococcoidia bacterium]